MLLEIPLDEEEPIDKQNAAEDDLEEFVEWDFVKEQIVVIFASKH